MPAMPAHYQYVHTFSFAMNGKLSIMEGDLPGLRDFDKSPLGLREVHVLHMCCTLFWRKQLIPTPRARAHALYVLDYIVLSRDENPVVWILENYLYICIVYISWRSF